MNVLQFRKGLWYNKEADIGCPHRNTAEKNNKHRITAKKNEAKHRHLNFKFCPSINLIQISI